MLTQEAATLVRPKLGVQALFLEQLGVAAFFDDAAFVQDDEAVHRGDGGKAVEMSQAACQGPFARSI